jgi:hypothetical protein
VGEDAEADLAALAVQASGSQRGAQPTLEHGEDRLDLPALAAGLPGKAAAQAAPVRVDDPRGPAVAA